MCPCRSLLFNNDPYQSLLFSPHFQRALTCYRVMACSPMTISHPELNPFCARSLLLVSDQIQMSFSTIFQQLIHFICSCHMGIAIFTAHLLSHREEQHIHWTLARTRAKASQLSQKQTALVSPENHSTTELMKLGFLSDTTCIHNRRTYIILLIWIRNFLSMQNSLPNPYSPLLVHIAKQSLSMQTGFLSDKINLETVCF